MGIIIERNIKEVCESCMSDDKVDLIKITHGDSKLEERKLCRMCQEELMLKLLDNIGKIDSKK